MSLSRSVCWRRTTTAGPTQNHIVEGRLRVGLRRLAIVLRGRKSGFRAGFRPDSNRESLKIGPPAGRKPAGGPNLMFRD